LSLKKEKIKKKKKRILIINKNNHNIIIPGPSCPSFAVDTGDVDPCKCGVNDID